MIVKILKKNLFGQSVFMLLTHRSLYIQMLNWIWIFEYSNLEFILFFLKSVLWTLFWKQNKVALLTWDGIPYSVYKKTWSIVGSYICESWKQSCEKQQLFSCCFFDCGWVKAEMLGDIGSTYKIYIFSIFPFLMIDSLWDGVIIPRPRV